MRGLLAILLFTVHFAAAQMPAFRSLTTANGLNDGTIRCFGQDKYGYIWIGTVSGLNRYNGYSVKQYINIPGDSTSVYPDHLWGMGLGPDSNMYFGSPHGLYRYNYASDNFTRIKAGRPFAAGRMVAIGKDSLLHASSRGLLFQHTATNRLHFFGDDVKDSLQKTLAQKGLGEIALLKDGRVVSTSNAGLLVFDLEKKHIRVVTVPGLPDQYPSHVQVAKNGTVWFSFFNHPTLVKTDTSFRKFEVFDYMFPARNVLPNSVRGILLDKDDRLWVITGPDGLCLYKPETRSFINYKSDPFLPASLHTNFLTAIFNDRQGRIWVGTEGYGVNYFHPNKKQFQTLFPRGVKNGLDGWLWARAASEDDDGNLWLAAAPGVIQYNERTGFAKHFQNDERANPLLYSNSIRGILCEGDWVWFVTGGGVNRYHRSTGKMDFLTEKEGLPQGFYFTGFRDSRGTVWIGGRDGVGLYYREKGNAFQGIDRHPVLNELLKTHGYGVRCIFEDSRHRLWLGLNGSGLALYDVQAQQLRHWLHKDGDTASLAGNLVTGIAEDRNGVIWISTIAGISSFDLAANRFTNYTQQNGLPALRTSGIRVDAENRVWAGSTHGLLMLDARRKNWKVFREDDGLAAAEFSDMPSQQLKDGRFIFPTLKGFVLFNPLDYREEKNPLPFYISALNIFNQPATMAVNNEELRSISLRHNQNFFSIELAALNYDNPSQTWYAYKLEGFDKDWIYTRDRIINYTNVPGGDYVFRFKASTNVTDWNVPEKTLSLSVGTVYYKTLYFWALMVFVVAFGLYSLYRFRMNKQRQILQLETKARELEKEKTVVQYESLKQHLNPHFLFNSLTSLRSLIKTDTKTATAFLDGLSKVYRYVLRSGEKELSLLKDEIDFVKTFVSLQKTRFREGLDVRIDVQEKYLERYIVPVTLQNLVENAIKHNTADEESPLKIIITAKDDCLCIQNNLQRYSLVESSNKQGLQSLRKLYRFYTGKSIIVADDGQFFIVKIPLL